LSSGARNHQTTAWMTVWGGYIGCTIWVPFLSNNPKHHNMILCLAIWNTQVLTYMVTVLFVKALLCAWNAHYHLMAPMMTSPVWFQIPKPKNKTERKKSNLPMAHYCMGNPSRFRHGRRHFVAGNGAKSSYVKVIRKVRRLGGETGQFRHNRESNA
jgi:hypothetical protein